MTPTFVVGGESSFVRTKIARQLSRHDMDVVGHWDWKRKRLVPIPKESEAVFVVTDMCSHRINDRTVAEAQKRKLPIIYGQRKYAENQKRLTAAGFPIVVTMEKEMPILPRGLKASLYQQAIAEDMSRDHDAVYERVEALCAEAKGGPYDPPVPGRSLVSVARAALGIAWARGRTKRDGSRTISVDLLRYETECATLGVHPYYPPGVIQITPKTGPEPKPQPAPEPQPKKPAVVLPDGLTQEFADILAMLRDEMLECDIQNLSITPDGVTFERVVIVTGTYDG